MITRRDFVGTNEGDRTDDRKGRARRGVKDTRKITFDKSYIRDLYRLLSVILSFSPFFARNFIRNSKEYADRRDEVYRSKMGEARPVIRLVI